MNLLFYSDDSYFLQEFSDYISRTQKDIQINAYADADMALDYLRQNNRRVDMILANDYFFDDLVDEDKLKVICSGKTRLTLVDGCFSVNIYQTGDDIVRDLRKLRVDMHTESLGVEVSEIECRTVAFFSTQGGSGQSTIAYHLAVNLAQNRKVLFIAFDFVNVYQHLYALDYPMDLAQVMFQIKDRQDSVGEFYKASVRNQHGVYVLPPFQSIGDIIELTVEDVNFLLEQLKGIGEFDYIILDMNHNVDALNQCLLQQVDKIVAVYTVDQVGGLKMKQFDNDPFVARWQIGDKIRFVGNKAVNGQYAGSQLLFPLVAQDSALDLFSCFNENLSFQNSCLELKNCL